MGLEIFNSLNVICLIFGCRSWQHVVVKERDMPWEKKDPESLHGMLSYLCGVGEKGTRACGQLAHIRTAKMKTEKA